jgi:hypothetical protein
MEAGIPAAGPRKARRTTRPAPRSELPAPRGACSINSWRLRFDIDAMMEMEVLKGKIFYIIMSKSISGIAESIGKA